MSPGTAAPVGDGGSADVLSRDAHRPPWGEMRSSTAWRCALLEDVCPRALEGRGLEQAAEMTLAIKRTLLGLVLWICTDIC